ncbi:hypothetical protein C490_12462 [Natronobacterium gregoryi SP2]|uniref:Uncharacterized protein n=1 Tax=Natronobacterium gregoryi (strain ATCC 43098 / DSM 3393 / CCM 3738 / CIP 104747 / IAM 13177 / JCM 8860 / NBRC 102187 / NCIMB 2189 / SP2) TaxID=797304 RepID=L9Y153_NATGS|nr:hypothetical protein C490_12462 [Natronobacterium gregoryi SP2]
MFPNTGRWLIFGVVLIPVYVVVIAWFTGVPRDTKTGLLGVGYLVGLTSGMWAEMFVLTILIGPVFFGSVPEPIGSVGP